MEVLRELTIFADYFQFVVQDETSKDDFSDIWSDEAFQRLLAVGESSICPGTLRNVDVEVEIRVLEQEPSIPLEQFDHVASASLSVPTGVLAVLGCTDYLPDAERIIIAPGSYQVLYLISGVSTVGAHWEPADDRYVLYLWPGPPRQAALLKHWRGNA